MRYAILAVIVPFCFTVRAAIVSGAFTDYISGSPVDTCRVILYAFSPEWRLR
ncbi:MAG: hypothetical protein JXA18_06560 [Chitinispirillaceae bacterium]|nr:hypothetical protein [Chitinispirillaceae bacterium]